MQKIPDILKKIIKHKQQEIHSAKQIVSLDAIKKTTQNITTGRGFVQSIQQQLTSNKPAIIAEIKKASPSKGILRDNFNPTQIAKQYTSSGATCLSVLTDVNFFKGSVDYLHMAHDACNLPILRKDFIIDEYQIYESKAMNADCILLIAAILDSSSMQHFSNLAQSLEMDVLIEVHNLIELEIALKINLPMIGINNRNLNTFATDLQTTIDLYPHIPKNKIIVTESGILKPDNVLLMQSIGVNTFLVGEAFMLAQNPGDKLKQLFCC